MTAKYLFFLLIKLYSLFFFKQLYYFNPKYVPSLLTVYSQDFYLRNYPSYEKILTTNNSKALFKYFNTTGIKAGECASPAFDIKYYLEKNPNLKEKFGYNYTAVYNYFLTDGIYNTEEFSPIFNAEYYYKYNPDLRDILENKREIYMDHFIKYGMEEGRKSSPYFSLDAYKLINLDLRSTLGYNNTEYFLHYITKGKYEGRLCNYNDVI